MVGFRFGAPLFSMLFCIVTVLYISFPAGSVSMWEFTFDYGLYKIQRGAAWCSFMYLERQWGRELAAPEPEVWSLGVTSKCWSTILDLYGLGNDFALLLEAFHFWDWWNEWPLDTWRYTIRESTTRDQACCIRDCDAPQWPHRTSWKRGWNFRGLHWRSSLWLSWDWWLYASQCIEYELEGQYVLVGKI